MNAERPPHAIHAASTTEEGPQSKEDLGSADRLLDCAALTLLLVLIYPAYLLVQANPLLALQLAIGAVALALFGSMLVNRDKTDMSQVAMGAVANLGFWFVYAFVHWSPLGLDSWAPYRAAPDSLGVNAVVAITTFLAAVSTAASVTSACLTILTSLFRAARAIHSSKTAP